MLCFLENKSINVTTNSFTQLNRNVHLCLVKQSYMFKKDDRLKQLTNYWLGCLGRVAEFTHFYILIWHLYFLGFSFLIYENWEKKKKQNMESRSRDRCWIETDNIHRLIHKESSWKVHFWRKQYKQATVNTA